MRRVFADSYYFFAMGNVRDPAHARTVEFNRSFVGRLVTTGWIVVELGDGMAHPPQRPIFLRLAEQLRTDPDVVYVPCAERLLVSGLDLFRRRTDKGWSLTDCISFVVMQEYGLTEALTGDHHFEQAGFTALLK